MSPREISHVSNCWLVNHVVKLNKYKDILIWVIVCLDLLLVTGMEMQTWSECTRKMIDAEFERREAMDYNCFLT